MKINVNLFTGEDLEGSFFNKKMTALTLKLYDILDRRSFLCLVCR